MYSLFKIPNTAYTLVYSSDINCVGLLNSKNLKDMILPFKKGNKYFVKFEWFNGLTEYDINIVICLSVNKANFSNDVLKQISIVYKTSDTMDISIDNTYYQFNNPIESKEKEGFYYIPYYSNYLISKDGVVLKKDTLEIKKGHDWKNSFNNIKNVKGGYILYQGFTDKFGSKMTTMARHRLMGLAFIKYKFDPFVLVINHKDGEPGNDKIDNLEWITKQENNQHAYDNNLITSKHRQIVAYNWITGFIKIYPTVQKCRRELKISTNLIYSSNNLKRKRSDGWGFKIFSKDEKLDLSFLKLHWYPEDAKIYYPPGTAILGKNYLTGEIMEESDVIKMSRKSGINPTSISESIKKDDVRLIKYCAFKFKHSEKDFPTISKDTLERIKLKYTL